MSASDPKRTFGSLHKRNLSELSLVPRLLLLLLLLLIPLCAIAQEGPTLHLHCDPSQPRIALAMTRLPDWTPSRPGVHVEPIEVAKLVTYGPEDERGDTYRLGSTSTTRTCGSLVVRVTGAFFNSKTQGEMGAADDYPIVELFDGDKPLATPLAVGECDASNGLYSLSAECPRNWASQIIVFFSGGSAVVHLRHEYEEFRSKPSASNP